MPLTTSFAVPSPPAVTMTRGALPLPCEAHSRAAMSDACPVYCVKYVLYFTCLRFSSASSCCHRLRAVSDLEFRFTIKWYIESPPCIKLPCPYFNITGMRVQDLYCIFLENCAMILI